MKWLYLELLSKVSLLEQEKLLIEYTLVQRMDWIKAFG